MLRRKKRLQQKSRLKAGKPLRRRSKLSSTRSGAPTRSCGLRRRAKREASWVVRSGIRYYKPYFSGREVCITAEAWALRRLESLAHFKGVCQCGCGQKFGYAFVADPTPYGWTAEIKWDAHHVNGRGRGRDDRVLVDGKPNLVPLIHDHHMAEHNQAVSNEQPQWSGHDGSRKTDHGRDDREDQASRRSRRRAVRDRRTMRRDSTGSVEGAEAGTEGGAGS